MKSNDRQVQNRLSLTFQPHPLVRNGHIQTIFSSLYGNGDTPMQQAAQEMILKASDGVRLQGYYSPQLRGRSKGLVLLLHGWLGSVNANYITTIGHFLYQRGYAIFRLNFRDHGDTHHLNPGLFRGDLLDEAFVATQRIAQLENNRPFHIIGASMGGSFALRLAGRCTRTPLPNLAHTIAINPAVNPHHTVLALDTGLFLYLAYFRRKWRKSFRKKKAAFPTLYDFSEALAARTCMAMTEAFIRYSPYATPLAYLDSYAVTPEMIATVCSPVTIITAADDPVVPVADFDSFFDLTPYLQVHIQPYGGHVGFIDIFPLRFWLCEAIFAILENEQIV